MRNFATRTSVGKHSVQNVFSVRLDSPKCKTLQEFAFSQRLFYACVFGVKVQGHLGQQFEPGLHELGQRKFAVVTASIFFSDATKNCEINTATRAVRPVDYTSCPNSAYMVGQCCESYDAYA